MTFTINLMEQRIGVLFFILYFFSISNGKIIMNVVNDNRLFRSTNTIYVFKQDVDLKGQRLTVSIQPLFWRFTR